MNSSPAVNLVILALSVVVAFVAYRASETFKKKNGVTPWNWPSWLWAFVGFLSFLLVLILFSIASRKTKPVAMSAFGAAGDPHQPVATPAYANLSTDPSGPAQGSFPATPSLNQSLPQPAAWHPDPTGRYATRYWDGTAWTNHVSDGQTTTTDPL